jgi:hypothetical protein
MTEINNDEYLAMVKKVGEPDMWTMAGRKYRIKISKAMRQRGFSLYQIADYLKVLPRTVSKYLAEPEQ